ncbi:MAG: tetratricopeptide repeat-containing protein [bacterium]
MPALIDVQPGPPSPCLGLSHIIHMAYDGQDLTLLANSLTQRCLAAIPDPGAVFDFATVMQTRGGPVAAEAICMLSRITTRQPSFQIVHGNGSGPRLLALMTQGDFMANTPVDFLLNGSDAVLIQHYVTADTGHLDLPPHDVAILAVAQSDQTAPVLANLSRLLARHPGPVLNNAALIADLTRDHVSALLADEPSILAPRTRRLHRRDLTADLPFPVLLRPIGSHAGEGLGRVAEQGDLSHWLAAHPEPEVYVAPFIDYRGTDRLFTKFRVVLIAGRPFASHRAASDHWMVHYLNAEMWSHADRRAAEADWMASFDTDFAARHAEAFAALHRIFGLDYFGIDCAETADGRLLVFEVDTAMIVHDMDDAAMFPYKKPAMKKLFDGFLRAVTEAA